MATTFSQLQRYGRIYSGGKVAVSADGALLAAACGDSISLVDLATGRLLLSVGAEGDEITAFAIHPSLPELVLAGSSRHLRHVRYSAAAGSSEQVRAWRAHKLPVVDLAFERTGTLAASAGADGAVMVFDVAKGYATHVFRGHDGVVHRVAFSPASSTRLASSGADHSVRLWDLASRECAAVLSAHVGAARALAWSADGATLISGGADQMVNVWDCRAARLTSSRLTSSLAVLEGVEAIAVDPPPRSAERSAEPPKLTFVTAGSGGTLRRWVAGSSVCLRRQPPPPAGVALPGLTHLLGCGGGGGGGGGGG